MIIILLITIILATVCQKVAMRWDKRALASYPRSFSNTLKLRTEKLHFFQSLIIWPLFISLRYKGERVIWRYVIGEFITILLLLFAYFEFAWTLELAVALWLTAILVIVVQTDLTNMIIPNKVVLTGIAGAVVLRFISHPLPWYEYVIGAITGSGALLMVAIVGQWLLRKEAMGGGDIKLYLFIGAILGWKLALLSLFLASVVGFIGGLAALIATRNRTGGRAVPFGPYIAIGTLAAYYWGEDMLNWYWSLLSITG